MSSVTYDQGSTMGTTTAASKSFNQSYSVSASLGIIPAADKVVTTSIAGAFTYTQGATNSESLEITKERHTIYTVHGSDRQDGINRVTLADHMHGAKVFCDHADKRYP